jgi:hypothetical protein
MRKYLKRMIRRKKNVRGKRKDGSPSTYSNDDNALFVWEEMLSIILLSSM